jgi:hypothetical protein
LALQAVAFYGLQLLCPLLGCFFAYLHAYQRRLKGEPGRELEVAIARQSAALAALSSLFFFWGWPTGAGHFYTMPGIQETLSLVLGGNPGTHPDLELIKIMVSAFCAGLAAVVARIFAGPLNRHLVRSVPRFLPAMRGFRRR